MRLLYGMAVGIALISILTSCARGEVASEARETVTIRLAAGHVGQQLQYLQMLAEDFNEEHPYIHIILLDFPDVPQEIMARYDQYLLSEDPDLDVLMIDVIWPGDLAEHLINLDGYFSETEIAAHFPATVDNNTVGGRLVAMPWFLDGGLLYYRSDLLEQYGREVPVTWAELEQTARYVQEQERAAGNQDFWGFIWQAGPGEGLTCMALELIHSHGGGRIVNQQGELDVHNPRAIAGLERARSWIGDITPEYALEFTGAEGPRTMWETGNFLFMRNWPYAYNLSHRPESPVSGRFDVARLPAVDDGRSAATLGGWQLGVSQYSEHPDEAAEVVRYLTSYETQLRRALQVGDFPTLRTLYQDERLLSSDNPLFSRLADVLDYTVARPSTITAPNYNDFSRNFYTRVHQVLAGELEADEALAAVELP